MANQVEPNVPSGRQEETDDAAAPRSTIRFLAATR
jgi:hypothetical protein